MKELDESNIVCLPDDRAMFDIEDILMRLPQNGKKLSEKEKQDLIREIKNVIAILEAEGGRDDEIDLLKKALKMLQTKTGPVNAEK